jgi:hypothetical protein
MADDVERFVSMAPVRDADRIVRAVGLSVSAPQRSAQVAELRKRVLGGYYATESMMDVVARRLVTSGDL